MLFSKALTHRLSLVVWLPALLLMLEPASAQSDQFKFATLQSFTGLNGDTPSGALIQASNGYLYGTTSHGGACGYGSVFAMAPWGTLTTIHGFCNITGPIVPFWAGVVQATNGMLYGTTNGGGNGGYGTVFEITPGTGAVTTLYSFCSQSGCSDGAYPQEALVQAANGDLYGTTQGGGTNAKGTIFRITTSGTLTTLYSFCSQSGCADGAYPQSPLIQAYDGNLYGTTESGGLDNTFCASDACGTIFEITQSGTFTTLHRFCSQQKCQDGSGPNAGLVQAPNGVLYGTTTWGGAQNYGTVFGVTPSGTFGILHSFCSQANCADGKSPDAALVIAPSGNLYGTTAGGGANGEGAGTIFEITPNGTLTTLYTMCSQPDCADGYAPLGLVQSTSGIFYGVTFDGGSGAAGTVFAFTTGEAPFIETRPAIGVVGEVVTIIGYGLKDATSVTFNGTPATILLDVPTAIFAQVPVGATSGKVTVTTPKGVLSTKVIFEVVP